MTLAKRESSMTRVATGAAALVVFLPVGYVFFGSLDEHHAVFSVNRISDCRYATVVVSSTWRYPDEGTVPMETHELLNRLEAIVDEAKTAIMATVDSAGRTHMRWMTPAVLKHRPGVIFAFSAPDAAKVEQVHTAGCAEWMFQTRDLRQIINVAGPARVIDNPALKSELLEILGSRLIVFWKANLNADEFVVIETVIEEATFFEPMKGTRQTVHFD